MKYFLTIIILIIILALSPLIIVIVAPIYFAYKIIDRRYTYVERKNGYSEREHKAPMNDLISFGLNMIKNSK